MADANRYDVVLFGGTGFTGKLVASYLNTHAQAPKWAIAGRSKDKLQKVHSSLGLKASVGIIEADNTRPQTLAAMARQAKCVINVVGPFRQLGADKLVEACIENGSHYVDLSGETGFNLDLIKRFHERAKSKGVVIAPSVGYDSLPSDVTTYLAVQHLKEKLGAPAAENAVVTLKSGGGMSTGTILSGCDMADIDIRQMQFCNGGWLATRTPAHEFTSTSSRWIPQLGGYAGGFLLSPHNVRTVYRSWSLLEDQGGKDTYGADFEAVDLMFGGNWAVNQALVQGQRVASFFLLYVPGVRTLLRSILPTGAGPSVHVQTTTKMLVSTLASYQSKSALCTFAGTGDPGYYSTARFIAETALALALDGDKLHPLGKQGGILTAATVGADVIAERLRKYASFEIFTKDFSQ